MPWQALAFLIAVNRQHVNGVADAHAEKGWEDTRQNVDRQSDSP